MKNRKVLMILLVVLAVLWFVFMELNQNYWPGRVASLLLFVIFGWLLAKNGNAGFFMKLLLWCGLFVSLILTSVLTPAPLKNYPAVDHKDPQYTETVHVHDGDLQGVYTEDGKVEIFTGIPYAMPPTGELRWKEPQDPEPWDGVKICDTYAPMSMQPQNSPLFSTLASIIGYHDYKINWGNTARYANSEDALYLNIWKPAGDVHGLPVMVYVHGGSLQTGQPWYADYSGEGLARKDCIVVNMGYRLGVFGFYADPQLQEESGNHTTGNYGLLDQIKALEWVRDNIAAFGGDPDNVTLAGESAGGVCVSALCTSPLAKGLFRRVIIESSTCSAPQPAHSFRLLDAAFRAARYMPLSQAFSPNSSMSSVWCWQPVSRPVFPGSQRSALDSLQAYSRLRLTRGQMEARFGQLTEWLLFGLIDFDFISEACLPEQCPQGGNPLKVGEMAYDAVIVCGLRTLRRTTLERLSAFRDAGGQLIFIGAAPDHVDALPSPEPAALSARSQRL